MRPQLTGIQYGNYVCGPDLELLPLIDHANIACGFHAGDPLIMQETVLNCKKHNIKVGAHPGLPDIQGKLLAGQLLEVEHDAVKVSAGVRSRCPQRS